MLGPFINRNSDLSGTESCYISVRTHQQSRVESHESCRVMSLVATCSILISQTPVTVGDGCYLEEEMDVEKVTLLAKDHEEIYDTSLCEHRNRVLH